VIGQPYRRDAIPLGGVFERAYARLAEMAEQSGETSGGREGPRRSERKTSGDLVEGARGREREQRNDGNDEATER
jgi:hypothetical protein